MELKFLSSKITNKKVLLRTDFNVPIKNNQILDKTRIIESLPTIKFLLKNNNSLIIISHLGRPKGKWLNDLSLYPIAKYLSKLLTKKNNLKIKKFHSDNFLFYKIKNSVYLLENIRFYSGEEKNSLKFAHQLSKLGDIFINDAFSVCHRAHASTFGITRFLPSYGGLLLQKEIDSLERVLKNPRRPLVCIIGGAKIETKLPLIKKLVSIADYLLLGGKIAFENVNIQSKKIYFPLDEIYDTNDSVKDIGKKTIKLYSELIKKAKTIFWNGPMGVFEDKKFEQGTKKIAEAVANSQAFTIIGGGETILAIKKYKLSKKVSFISTGGGATLEYLAGEKMPGLEALKK